MKYIYSLVIALFATINSFSQVIPTLGAGNSSLEPAGYQYEGTAPAFGGMKDAANGTNFYYLQNDSIYVGISDADGANNLPNGMHRGGVADIINKRGNTENIDWGEFLISTATHTDWNLPNNNPQLNTITVDAVKGTITATGYSAAFPTLRMSVKYSTILKSPILKMEVSMINEGIADFKGFVEYMIDPDGSDQNSWASGLGQNFGSATSGWSRNYLYTGRLDQNYANFASHGIAWLLNQPARLVGLNFINGAWFEANVKKGDTTTFTVYHITDVPRAGVGTKAQNVIEKWATKLIDLDTAIGNKFKWISGKVEDIHAQVVPNTTVKFKNIDADLVTSVRTDAQGNYMALVPKQVYTITVSTLGYQLQSRSIDANFDSTANFIINDNFALRPIVVSASTGKEFTANGLALTTEKDIILENEKIQVGIAVVTINPQVALASRGIPLDMVSDGVYEDNLDWLTINKLSLNNDTIDRWWSEIHTYNDTVYVGEVTSDSATVIAEGRYFRKKLNGQVPAQNEVLEVKQGIELFFRTDISIKTKYIIEPNNYFYRIRTIIENKSLESLKLFAGDILDMDGSGQTTFIPGHGLITGAGTTEASVTFQKNAPWFSQHTAGKHTIGVIYEDEYGDFSNGYGTNSYISHKNRFTIAPGTSQSWSRLVVIRNTDGYTFKPDAIAEIYNEIKQNETGIEYSINATKGIVRVGDTISLDLIINNKTKKNLDSTVIKLNFNGNLKLVNQTKTFLIQNIDSNSISTFNVKFIATSGGRGINSVLFIDSANNSYEYKFSSSVTGSGWYTGDNHTHSIFSDGVGTIAQNVASGYQKGLSFMSSTDHNTLNQRPSVIAEQTKYQDMVLMVGEEITTSMGHALGYNINTRIPWQLTPIYTQQDIIDSVRRNINEFGIGYMYIAHPHYPGLPWKNYALTGYTGLEVWNGFYHATHNVNAFTFNNWDSIINTGQRILGISNSDAHNPDKVGANYIVAYLNDLTKDEIFKTVRDRGHYYGSNGPRMDFSVETFPMGSGYKAGTDARVPAAGRTVTATLEAHSHNGQKVNSMRILKNGVVVQNINPNNTDTTINFKIAVNPNDYLRAIVEVGSGYAYSNPIWFAVGNNNANIVNIIINGKNFTPFNQNTPDYVFPDTVTEQPTLQVIPTDPKARVTVTLPKNIFSENAADRTAYFTITSEDGSIVRNYTVEFNSYIDDLSDNANVIEVFVNDKKLQNFSMDVFDYNYPDTVQNTPIIKVTPSNPSAVITITPPVDVFSEDSLDRIGYFTIQSEDSSKIFNFSISFNDFVGLPSYNADIVSVIINNKPYLDFNIDSFSYVYPDTVDNTPSIVVIPSDTNAVVNIVYPLDVYSKNIADRLATITITSEDGKVIRTYQIEFNGYVDDLNSEALILKLFINTKQFLQFNPNVFSYFYPDTITEQPVINVETSHPSTNVSIVYPTDIFSENPLERTAYITITSEDKKTTFTYSVEFITPKKVVINSVKNNGLSNVKIFPNPSVNVLNVNNLKTNFKYEVYQVSTGKLMMIGSLVKGNNAINVSELSAGEYMISLDNEAQNKEFVKFTKID